MDSTDRSTQPRRYDFLLVAGGILLIFGLITALTGTDGGIPPLVIVGVAVIAAAIIRRFAFR